MEVDPEVDEAEGVGLFFKTVLQTFRTCIGELGMPKYDGILKSDSSYLSQRVNIYLIWAVWYTQTFICLIVMLNFIIAVISSTYNKYGTYQKIISYKNKADLNSEFYELFSMMGKYNEEIKLIAFSNSKDTDSIEDDPMKNTQVEVKKHISKQNKFLTRTHENI
jgi:hypothetical protein